MSEAGCDRNVRKRWIGTLNDVDYQISKDNYILTYPSVAYDLASRTFSVFNSF